MATTTTAAAELVFVPAPAAGHLFSAVELAKQLVNHDQRLSVTVCVTTITTGFKVANLTADSSSITSRIRLVHLPVVEISPNTAHSQILPSGLEASKPHIKQIASDIIRRHHTESGQANSPRLAGFVTDMFCTAMIDVANEFGVPCYVFYTSGANFLAFMLHLQALHDEGKLGDLAELKDSESEMAIPGLKNPLPCKCLPSAVVEKDWLPLLVDTTRRLREVRGIAVNTFLELESHALDSLAATGGDVPPVYPVGPLLNLKPADETKKKEYKEVMEWLDDQPAGSVVFLCFGSMGSFVKEQVTEIAVALERWGHRFLWSLRRPAEGEEVGPPSEYENFDDALPEGFLDRMSGIGKVIGWAPQTAVLGHESVGGFVSHCGWNSVLESIWFGVPVGAWPMYAEQQLNAFQLVEELGLAEEIKMDYQWDSGKIVTSEEIEGGIRRLMTGENKERKRKTVKEMSEMSKKALMEGGSSHCSMTRLIQDMIDNIR